MGYENVTLKIVDNSGKDTGKTYTCNVENKSFINSIINVGKDNTITINDAKTLQNIAGLSGDISVIEESDIRGINNLKQAIENKSASYSESLLNIISFGFLDQDGGSISLKLPTSMKMSEIREKFNLPKDALEDYLNNSYGYGFNRQDRISDKNVYEIEKDEQGNAYGRVWFDAKDFAEANRLTIEDLKKMFGIE